MAITWSASMATGVQDVDDQHKELLKQVGRLTEAMSRGQGRDEVARILDFLAGYAVRHFAEEEAWMDRCACPAAAANKRAHAQFLTTFKSLRQRFDRDGATPTLVLEIQNTLSDWLGTHIRQIDVQLRDCVAAPAC